MTDKLLYKTEYIISKEQWSFIKFINSAIVWSGHVQYNHSFIYDYIYSMSAGALHAVSISRGGGGTENEINT